MRAASIVPRELRRQIDPPEEAEGDHLLPRGRPQHPRPGRKHQRSGTIEVKYIEGISQVEKSLKPQRLTFYFSKTFISEHAQMQIKNDACCTIVYFIIIIVLNTD